MEKSQIDSNHNWFRSIPIKIADVIQLRRDSNRVCMNHIHLLLWTTCDVNCVKMGLCIRRDQLHELREDDRFKSQLRFSCDVIPIVYLWTTFVFSCELLREVGFCRRREKMDFAGEDGLCVHELNMCCFWIQLYTLKDINILVVVIKYGV